MTKWHLKAYTHEMLSPAGIVIARLRVAANYQIALDDGSGEIYRSGGSAAFGYHVGYNIKRRDEFPADDIDCELHYFTGKSYVGNTIKKTV